MKKEAMLAVILEKNDNDDHLNEICSPLLKNPLVRRNL